MRATVYRLLIVCAVFCACSLAPSSLAEEPAPQPPDPPAAALPETQPQPQPQPQEAAAPAPEPTPAPAAPRPASRSVQIHVLTVDPVARQGFARPVTLRLDRIANAGTTPTPLKISIAEDISAGSGQLLRSSAWMAAMVASLTINEPLVNTRIEIETEGRIEGPSAGGMFAIAMLCLLNGDTLPPGTTMSGSINPDGSIGPVNGIPQKLEAARGAGLRKIVLPACQRFDRDLVTGAQIDLASRSRELGLEPVFARDLDEAYMAATGKHAYEFMPPTPEPAYNQSAFDFLSGACQTEIATFEANRPLMEEVLKQKETRPAAQALLKKIREDHTMGRDAFQAGKVFVAAQLLREANTSFSVLQQLVKTSPKFTPEMREAWSKRGDELRAELSRSFFTQSSYPSSLLGGLMFAEQSSWQLDLGARINRSQLMVENAQTKMGQAGTDKKNLENLGKERDYFTLLLFYANLNAEFQYKSNHFFPALLKALPPALQQPSPRRVASWVPVMLQAQLASSEYFRAGSQLLPKNVRDDLVTDHQLATFFQFGQMAAQNWQAYAGGQNQTPEGAQPPPPAEGIVQVEPLLQAFLWANAYCHSALLYQKYVGFGGYRNDKLEWQTMNRSALIQTLEVAQRNALAGIGMAGASGADTSILAMVYERACWFRDANEDSDKISALLDYWRVALFGKLCSLLSQPGTT